MMQEGDVLSDAEDDSEGESDFVIEDEVIYDFECDDSEHDEVENSPVKNSQSVMDGLEKTGNHGRSKKCLFQQSVSVLKISFEKDQDLKDKH